jgi:adenine phosphoribosyltransferase
MSTEDFQDGLRLVRTFANFPRPGVTYYDLTPLLQDSLFFGRAMERFARNYSRRSVNYVISPESRGWMFGAALAAKIGAGFVPVARYGTLPHKSIKVTCAGGYHRDVDNVKELTIHEDAFSRGAQVLIVDDILGSGNTTKACIQLAETLGAKVLECAYFLEIPQLKGRETLAGHSVYSLMSV